MVNNTRKHPKIAVSMSSKKNFLCRFQVLEYFSTTRNERIFLFPRALPGTCVMVNSCILDYYTRKHPKIAVWMSSKKIFFVGFRFSNFFRLLETTEIFFSLGLFLTLVSAWTHVFWFITQENTRKLQSKCPRKKFFSSVSGSRIFFDYSKRMNFSFP